MATVAAGTFGRLWREIHGALDPGSVAWPARLFRRGQGVLLIAGLGAAILGTVPEIDAAYGLTLTVAALAVAACYAAEYAIRLGQAPLESTSLAAGKDAPVRAGRLRMRWAASPLGLIDLIAAAPVPLALCLGATPQTARTFGILWALKLIRYTPAFALVVRVVRNEARALSGVMVGFLIVLLIVATGAYLLERNSGAAGFGSIPGALWWAIVTVTTTGYGDKIPATFAGRVLGGLAMVCGIAMFALWAGILASGFAQEIRRRDFLNTWNLVARMPLFSVLGAAAIADVARLLRPQEAPEGRTVVRKGQPGDCMYFIAVGEVEVRTETGPVTLGAGGFFGEMALITGEPRKATVVTTKRSTLLRLDVADFRGLMAGQPHLVQVINAEAARRGLGPSGEAMDARPGT